MNKVIGITGTMASGKSYLCNSLSSIAESRNIPFHTIGIDPIRRNILQFSSQPRHLTIRRKIAGELGLELPDTDQLSGSVLGEIIFADKLARAKYQAILVPEIIKEVGLLLHEMKGLIVVEWAMLIEDGMLDLVRSNLILTVCNERTRMQRLRNPDIPPAQLRNRILSQPTDIERMERIRTLYQKKDTGFYLVFDTTNDPGTCEYEKLFDEVLQKL